MNNWLRIALYAFIGIIIGSFALGILAPGYGAPGYYNQPFNYDTWGNADFNEMQRWMGHGMMQMNGPHMNQYGMPMDNYFRMQGGMEMSGGMM